MARPISLLPPVPARVPSARAVGSVVAESAKQGQQGIMSTREVPIMSQLSVTKYDRKFSEVPTRNLARKTRI